MLFHLRNVYVTLTLANKVSYFNLLFFFWTDVSGYIVTLSVIFGGVCVFHVTVFILCLLCQVNQSIKRSDNSESDTTL